MSTTDSFSSVGTASKMRDLIALIVAQELRRLAPRPQYATVDKIDTLNGLVYVKTSDDEDEEPIPVRAGAIQPEWPGQVVRINGAMGDHYVEDVAKHDEDIYRTVIRGAVLKFGAPAATNVTWSEGYLDEAYMPSPGNGRYNMTFQGSSDNARVGAWMALRSAQNSAANPLAEIGENTVIYGDLIVTGDVMDQGSGLTLTGKSMPRGRVAHASIYGIVSTPTNGAETTAVTNAIFTVVSGRSYRATIHTMGHRSDNVADTSLVKLYAGANMISQVFVDVLNSFVPYGREIIVFFVGGAVTDLSPANGQFLSLAAGSYTFRWAFNKNSGTGNAATMAMHDPTLMIEDIGV